MAALSCVMSNLLVPPHTAHLVLVLSNTRISRQGKVNMHIVYTVHLMESFIQNALDF